MNRSHKLKFTWVYQCAAAVLIFNGFVCLRQLSVMSKDMEQVIRARETVAAINRFSQVLKDAELAESGFLLMSDDHAVARLDKAIKAIDGPLGELTLRGKGDPDLRARVASLRHVVEERKAQMVDAAKLLGTKGQAAAVGLLYDRAGQSTWGEIIRLVVEMEAAEDAHLRVVALSARHAIGRTVLTVLLASGLALTLLTVVYFVNRRELARRERANDEIRERELWFSATLASISDAVIATDASGRVRLINPVAQQLTGWTLNDSKGKRLEEVFPLLCENSRLPVENHLARILSEGVSTALSNHTLLVARDGSEHPVEHCGAPIRDANGATTGVVLCFRDITKRRRAELELRASKEAADAANRAKDQFLAVLSHELRKPLTPVLVAVTGILEQGPSPALAQTLELIRRNIELESRLIDDLLDVSRIARGGLRLRTAVVDLHDTIRQAVAMCHTEILATDLRIELEFSARSHHVLADETRLMQVVWNLITNAAKFTRDGGRLTIVTWNEDAAERPAAPGRLIVEFQDTGIGIEPGSLTRIFEPFEQGDEGFRSRYGGLGLGLAICYGIVEAHGGQLFAMSPGPRQGSTFRLEVSSVSAPRPVPRQPLPIAPRDGPGPLRILLVEDNTDTLRYLALVLSQRGHDVATASTLEGARAALGEPGFDLLISDIQLPDGSGLELMRELAPLPGIALSGFGSDEDIRMSESAGFSKHLTKPVTITTLESRGLRR